MEDEKKFRRAAANVNERRRMQNINSGFESLRDLINVSNKGKLSKSALLRHAVDMIQNLLSENGQLREQNAFLRNLYADPAAHSSSIIPSYNQHATTATKTDDEIDDKETDTNTRGTSTSPPKKKVKLSGQDRHTSTPCRHCLSDSPSFKLPQRYSPHVNKLLTSPKRMTRSSVIQQNYTRLNHTPLQGTLLESPSRRSLRIQEKELLLTPPSSSSLNITGISAFAETPNHYKLDVNSSSKIAFSGLFTPESVKGAPVRNAKRSLDAIIQAIDQIESGPTWSRTGLIGL